jgi:hypothetical protein
MRGSTPDRSHAWIGEALACFMLALIEYWMQVPLRTKIECGGGVRDIHASATCKRSVPAIFPIFAGHIGNLREASGREIFT